MKINDILNEDSAVNPEDKPMTADQIAELERFADSEFEKYDLDVEFTRHFIDRLTDARGGRNAPLTFTDVKKLFSKMANQRGDEIANYAMDGGEGGIMKDKETSVNSPFGIKYNRATREYELVMVTVMRHPNFRSNNPNDKIFTTESIHAPLIRKAMTLAESGSVEGTGPIAREEIMPTIEAIEKDLGIKLSDVTLGSAAMNKAGTLGKKQFSGDIDAAVNIAKEDRESFEQKLKDSPLILDYRMGNTVSTKVKIVNYDANREFANGTKPEGRTGYVQFDFMPGNPAAKKAFYHSPEEGTSNYKGALRTELLIITAAVWDQNNSEETTPDGRPLESERWVFSPDHALVRVLRKPKMGKKGYTKAHTQEVIGEPITDPDEIARTLGLGSGDDLDSFESLWTAINTHYDEEHVDLIRGIAMKNHVIGPANPEELTEWVPLAVAAGQAAMAGARMAAPHIARAALGGARAIAKGANRLFKGGKNTANKTKKQSNKSDKAKDVTKRDPGNMLPGGYDSDLDIEQQDGADMWRRHRGTKR